MLVKPVLVGICRLRFARRLPSHIDRRWKFTKSYVCGPGNVPLLGNNIGELIDIGADKWGDEREAFVSVHQGIRKNFFDVKKESEQLAAGFHAMGVNRGDRLGIWGPNTYEWYLTQMAAAKLGAILVNINPAYQPQELKYCLNKVGVKALVASRYFKSQNYYSMLVQVMPGLGDTKKELVSNPEVPTLERIIMIGEGELLPGTLNLDQVFVAGGSEDHQQLKVLKSKIQMDDSVNIQFTSGTTGNPKGACLSHHNIVNNAYSIGLRIGYDREYARVLLCSPLYHTMGCVIGTLNALIHGSALIIASPSFDPKACVGALEGELCTSVYGTPTMFIDMLAEVRRLSSPPSLLSLRTGLMAGAPCPEELCKAVVTELNMTDFVVAYGMTETSPVTFQGFADDEMSLKTGTIGYPSDHTEVKVIDDIGEIVPVGVAGELCTRGYSTMLGYWGDKEKTDEVYKQDRWFHTGDTAVIFENGYGQIVGRMKDMIIRGGENIYPREVEEYLHTHPDIAEVQAIGVADKRLGEELAAWVRLREDHNGGLTEDGVRKFCRGKLAHYKVPKYVYFVTQFPTTVTGKVQKFKMREQTEKWIRELEKDDA